MPADGPKPLPALGFLSVCVHADFGFFGGYLVLNATGRPLEFHCTAPVRPTRTQEILYGPTLEPYIYGEQIGKTLLERTKLQPLCVFTDSEPAMAVRPLTHLPVVLVSAPPTPGLSPQTPAHFPQLLQFSLGRQAVAVHRDFARDQAEVTTLWRPYVDQLDLLEPFSRIHSAIEEAQRGARAA